MFRGKVALSPRKLVRTIEFSMVLEKYYFIVGRISINKVEAKFKKKTGLLQYRLLPWFQ